MGVSEEHIVDPKVTVVEHVKGIVVPPCSLEHAVQHDISHRPQLPGVTFRVTWPRIDGFRY